MITNELELKYGKIIADGIENKYIIIEEDDKYINYCAFSKRYRFTDPEELVRAEIFIKLIAEYKYPANRIQFEVSVPRRTPNDWADIVVFRDDACKDPYIVVECKQKNVTNAEFIQAIEQGFGNANSLRASYLWVTSGAQSKSYDVKNYKPQERELNIISAIPINYKDVLKAKYAKGGFYFNTFTNTKETAFELETLTESELTRAFKQAHDSLWAGGKRNPSEAFDELDKLIFCKLMDEKDENIEYGQYYRFQKYSNETNSDLLKRVNSLYDIGKQKDPEVFKENIRLTASEVATVVGFFERINIGKTDLDSKGKAFETFLGSYFRGDFGQYFTPRTIVEFIVESLPIDNKDFVMDTSCGSGGFLLYALNKVRGIAEEKYENNRLDKDGCYKYWHNFAANKLYGIEISESIARSAKMNMIIHDDGHTNVVSHDALSPIETIAKNTKNDRIKSNMFDYILTNPPFGSTIRKSENPYLSDYELGKKSIKWIDAKLKNQSNKKDKDNESTEVLFLEQAHNFLKDKGILAIVLPDGILTNSSMQDFRDWIMEKYRIIASVSMPEFAFSAKDANVKSSVLFLQKYPDATTKKIRAIKQNIQDDIFDKKEFGNRLKELDKEKKEKHKELEKQIKDKELLKTEKDAITEEYKELIENVRDDMQDAYLEELRKQLPDYPIFMAIAEKIGYDATGKEIAENELKEISKQLNSFIEKTVQGEQNFF